MIDTLIAEFDKALRTVFVPAATTRPCPGAELPEADLSPAEQRRVAGLMRVNHSGEICAQALYQGQAILSDDPAIRDVMARAAREETEHLNWTAHRIAELGGHKSRLNPLWYAGSLALGLVAGKLGTRWNLGFLAETERQVEHHLTDHLGRLPPQDARSRAIIDQMKADEIRHAHGAERLGAANLPLPVRLGMKLASKVMTRTAFWV